VVKESEQRERVELETTRKRLRFLRDADDKRSYATADADYQAVRRRIHELRLERQALFDLSHSRNQQSLTIDSDYSPEPILPERAESRSMMVIRRQPERKRLYQAMADQFSLRS